MNVATPQTPCRSVARARGRHELLATVIKFLDIQAKTEASAVDGYRCTGCIGWQET